MLEWYARTGPSRQVQEGGTTVDRCGWIPGNVSSRAMKIHEYQARTILSEAGIPVPPAEVVRTPEEAADAFKKFKQPMCVVKAQVYAGGRGKAGFVKLVKSADEARDAAKFMLTHRMTSY